MPKKDSPLNNEKAMVVAVQNSSSVKEALKLLGLRPAGGNYRSFYDSCERFGITPPTYSTQERTRAAREAQTIPLDLVLVENSSYANGSSLKRRLFKEGLLTNLCSECGLRDTWNDKPITLQLDHINGVHSDNRLENLRVLCPNCHSQTETFCGRSALVAPLYGPPAPPKSKPTKIAWPSNEMLVQMVAQSNYSAVGRELGVSDNAVRKRLKQSRR